MRQFGLLASFSGKHASGNPVFRAASSAWIIQQLLTALQPEMRLRLSVSMACGISEAGPASKTDIYPGLYCQQVVDELGALVSTEPEAISLNQAASGDADRSEGIILESGVSDPASRLQGFTEPCLKLLERQLQILIREHLPTVRGMSS